MSDQLISRPAPLPQTLLENIEQYLKGLPPAAELRNTPVMVSDPVTHDVVSYLHVDQVYLHLTNPVSLKALQDLHRFVLTLIHSGDYK